MQIIQSLINLILVPLIALYVKSIRRNDDLKFSAVFLCEYAVAVAINIILAKAIATGLSFYTGYQISADRTAFTGCAFFAALIQPFLWEAWTRFLKFSILEKDLEKTQ